MKKILTIFALASIFAACKNQSSLDKTKDVVLLSDTLGAYKSNYSTDTSSMIQTNVVNNGTSATGVVGATGNNTTTASPKAKVPSKGTGTRAKTNSTGNGTSGSNGNSGTTATNTKKKGWSKAAKGAVIGGVGGAVAGAVISKNKGKGAIIGGVVGAAGGYIIGRDKDKKDGRVK